MRVIGVRRNQLPDPISTTTAPHQPQPEAPNTIEAGPAAGDGNPAPPVEPDPAPLVVADTPDAQIAGDAPEARSSLHRLMGGWEADQRAPDLLVIQHAASSHSQDGGLTRPREKKVLTFRLENGPFFADVTVCIVAVTPEAVSTEAADAEAEAAAVEAAEEIAETEDSNGK